MYIGDYLGRRAIYSPEQLAIVDTGKEPAWRLTYAKMNERANRLANWLTEVAHVSPGDRVAIVARDGVEHLDAFFACAKIGAIHTALNWRLHWREMASIFRETTPAVLIYSDDFLEAIDNLRNDPAGASLAQLLHVDGDGLANSHLFESAVQNAAVTEVSNENVDKETTAAIIFTGGTSGLPRAVKVSHRMIAWNTLNTVIHDLHHGDVYLNVFPMFHTGGLFVYTLPQIIMGGKTILTRQFDPNQVLRLIEEEEVTVFAGVPTMYQMITRAEAWESADLSSLRFCTSGGAPLPVPLVRKYSEEKGVRFKQGFGMTEFGPGIFALAPSDAIEKAGSIGRPNFYVDARVVDDANRPLGPGEIGELVLKGPSFSSGYFDNPEESEEVVDDEGWFHTGDLATYDAGWYFYIVDRKKDMYISGGENVYPAEIEKALYEHPAVHMCAVVGIPDDRWGEVGLACVVLEPEWTTSADELLAHLRDRLARYKVPKRVVFLESLPVSAAGKILKRELRSRFIPNEE